MGVEGRELRRGVGQAEERLGLGVAEDDHLVQANGAELTDLDQVTALVGQALQALDTSESHTAEFIIDRGEFQRLKLAVEVR